MIPITYRSTDVSGLKVFYRESGPVDAPRLLLLHGYPSASHIRGFLTTPAGGV